MFSNDMKFDVWVSIAKMAYMCVFRTCTPKNRFLLVYHRKLGPIFPQKLSRDGGIIYQR